MARDPKLEVAAANIRIPESHKRNYSKLVERLASLRRGVRVYGDSYLAISHFDVSKNLGVFSKYTEIDIDGDWFNLDDFDIASPDDIDSIVIPENLKPNHGRFYFMLDESLHVIAFSSYAESRGLSARSVERYLSEALSWPEVIEEFGVVEADIIKSYSRTDEILDTSELRELRIIIRRPNTDDVGEGLAQVIERRLKEQNGDEYEEALRVKGNTNLIPNQRTRDLAQVAAENGKIKAKMLVNGVMREQDTSESPLIEATKYKPEEAELTVFSMLARNIFGKISEARARLGG